MRLPEKFAFGFSFYRSEAEPPCEREFFRFPLRNGMGMGFLNDLNLVFNLTEKAVSVGELIFVFIRNEPVLREFGERGESSGDSDLRNITAIDELQGLGKELDFANSPIAEFDVSLLLLFAQQFVFNAQLHVAKLVDGREVEVAPVNERLDVLQKSSTQLAIAGNRSCFDQCRSFPALSP